MFQSAITQIKISFSLSFLISTLSLTCLARDFRVEGAGLEAVPASYNGACPGVIKFNGKIQANGQGAIKYRFVRSDGATGPIEYLNFDSAGVKYVSTTWTLGDASSLPSYQGWEAIKILSPNEVESNRANFKLVCKGGPKKESNIGAFLRKSGQFYVLADLLEDSGLARQLDEAKAFTLFAPNDAAFGNLPKEKLDAYRRDPQQLGLLLQRHVMLGRISLAEAGRPWPPWGSPEPTRKTSTIPKSFATPFPEITNLKGQQIVSLEIKCDKSGCGLGNDHNARVIRADIESGNGFVNEIDQVMFRPIFNPPL